MEKKETEESYFSEKEKIAISRVTKKKRKKKVNRVPN